MKISNIVAAAGLLVAAGVASADAGPFGLNWTFKNNLDGGAMGNGNGAINANSMSVHGSDGASGSTISGWETVINFTGQLSFDWKYSTADSGPQYDPAVFVINGAIAGQITDDNGGTGQGGNFAINVTSGQTIGIGINSVDNVFGAADLSASNFLPAPGAGVLLGMGGLLAARRRR